MPSVDSRRPTPYHPFSAWNAPPDRLERLLVGRAPLLHDLLNRIARLRPGASVGQVLLIGPRGIGKTHLLTLLNHYVSGRLALPKEVRTRIENWQPVFMAEEEYAQHNSLAEFLRSAVEKLADAQPDEPLWQLPADLSAKDDRAVCDCCFERLKRAHEKRGCRVLLLVDNLQKILPYWTTHDQQRLRAFLSRSPCAMIIGSSPSIFSQILGQRAVFHDFFELQTLGELDNEQVLGLLEKMFEESDRRAEFEKRATELREKVAAIQTLTGGNPRLVVFLFEVATQSAFLEIETALRRLLEDLREYFVRRFDDLPAQPRKILDTLAQMPGPATPTELAKTARLSRVIVNTQIRRLARDGYVRTVKLKPGRETRYDISERLFRIWRQTASVAGRQRFRLLVDFLKLYFTPEEVQSLYRQHLENLEGSREARDRVLPIVEELYYFQSAAEGPLRREVFAVRIAELLRAKEWKWAEQEAQHFAGESIKIDDREGRIAAYEAQMRVHLSAGELDRAESDLERLSRLAAWPAVVTFGEQLVALQPSSSRSWETLGLALAQTFSFSKALDAFRRAAEVGRPSGKLWVSQALILSELRRYSDAVRCARQAVKLEPKTWRAWATLSFAYHLAGLPDKGAKALRKAANVGKPTAIDWALQAMSSNALKRWTEAAECARHAVSLDPKSALAWEQMGIARSGAGAYADALEAFRKAADIKPSADLWSRQGDALLPMGHWTEAAACYRQALTLDSKLARAWESLCLSLAFAGAYGDALEAFQKAAELEAPSALLWWAHAFTLRHLDRVDEAEASLDKAAELEPKRDVLIMERRRLHLHAGRFAKALSIIDEQLARRSKDQTLRAERSVARACLDATGPSMEALPKVLVRAGLDVASTYDLTALMLGISRWAAREDERHVATGLYRAALGLAAKHPTEWFGTALGAFLRQVLDVRPSWLPGMIDLLDDIVTDDKVLTLLAPYRRARDYARTRDVAILEKLFPETRELVLDIVRRMSPDRAAKKNVATTPADVAAANALI